MKATVAALTARLNRNSRNSSRPPTSDSPAQKDRRQRAKKPDPAKPADNLHWRLDVVFLEDDCRVRKGHGPENFAVLRHITLNLINREKSTKGSFKAKRYRAALSDQYRLKVLTG